MQQENPRRLHQGVQRHPLATGEGFQAFGGRRVVAAVFQAVAAALGRARQAVGQHGGLGEALQARAPEVLRLLRVLRLQPVDVVAVAALLGDAFAVVAAQGFGEQLGIAPAVEQDVVVGVDQLVAVLGAAHEHQAQQRRTLQVEAAAAFGGSQLVQCCIHVLAATPVQDFQRQLDTFVHGLKRLIEALPVHAGAQVVMGIQRSLPGAAEALDVQPLHFHAQLVDVDAPLAAVHAVEQHALLHGRQRVEVFDLVGVQTERGQLGGIRCLYLSRGNWHLGVHHVTGHTGQCLQRLVLEQVLRAQLQPGGTRAADHLDGNDGVAAQLEEIVVQADPFQAQHGAPDGRERLLALALRRAVAFLQQTEVRLRQGLAVQLAVRRERHALQLDDLRRDHVIRQLFQQRGTQVGIDLPGDVADQLLDLPRIASDHHCLAHAGLAEQARLDLAQFDTEAANLHLVVEAAEVLQHTVCPPARQVAGAVHAPAWLAV